MILDEADKHRYQEAKNNFSLSNGFLSLFPQPTLHFIVC